MWANESVKILLWQRGLHLYRDYSSGERVKTLSIAIKEIKSWKSWSKVLDCVDLWSVSGQSVSLEILLCEVIVVDTVWWLRRLKIQLSKMSWEGNITLEAVLGVCSEWIYLKRRQNCQMLAWKRPSQLECCHCGWSWDRFSCWSCPGCGEWIKQVEENKNSAVQAVLGWIMQRLNWQVCRERVYRYHHLKRSERVKLEIVREFLREWKILTTTSTWLASRQK